MAKLWPGVSLLLVIICSAAIPSTAQQPPNRARPAWPLETRMVHSEAQQFAPDRVLVRFRQATTLQQRQHLHASVGAVQIKPLRLVQGLQVVYLATGVRVSDALLRYRSNPAVLYAEPDYRRTLFDVVPDDPMFTLLWGLRNTGQSGGLAGADIDAVKAWQFLTGSSDVVVGTIDTGVDWNHPDLAANIYHNDGDCFVNGIDDDGNGFIDDCHGFDGAAGYGDPIDTLNHGTHVAGIIGATGNNRLGVVGVNWNVKILACKTDDVDGNLYDSAILACLEYMARMKDKGVNIVATNNSYGGIFESQAITDGIREQMKRGILFVAAAGNYGLDNDSIWVYPANTDLPNVLAVAATDNSDRLAIFSDFGRHTVHLGAPGVAITSTVPGGGYESWEGTSMATPYVAGAAALLQAYDASLDWVAIKNRILAGGDTLASMSDTISGRRLNVFGSMTCAGQEVLARLQPPHNNTYVAIGGTVSFRMLHISCAQPAGELTLSIGNGPPLTLRDDGQNGDEAAGDGVYSVEWIPPAAGRYVATFSNGEVVTVNVLKPYIFSTTAYKWRTITGTLVPTDWFYGTPAAIASPFPFRFGGLTFDSLAVDAYGTIEMLGGQEQVGWGVPDFDFPIPTVFADTLLAPLWDDIFDRHDLDPAQGVYWEAIGQAPNRELVVEWRGFHHYTEFSYPGANGTVTLQVAFSESSDDVIFNYADTTFDNEWYDYGKQASVGIQVSREVGMQFSYHAPVLSPELAVRWSTSNSLPTSIEILWPNGGDVWRPGETHYIAWSATGPAATDFRIELLKADAIDSVITATVPAASGSFPWTMPLNQARGTDYKIRLVSNSDSTTSHTSASSFTVDDVYVLEVWANYWGAGTVTSSPPGIQCHEVCHAPFAAGTRLTLAATPDPGNQFIGWDGACSGTGPCVITMTEDIVVAAGFRPEATPLPDFSLTTQPSQQAVTAGEPAQFTITVAGSSGFSGTVQFACTAGLPVNSSCSFSPPSVTGGATPVSTMLTINTSAGSLAVVPSPEAWQSLFASLVPAFGLLCGAASVHRSNRRRFASFLAVFLLVLPLAIFLGCGGGSVSNRGGRARTYNVTVTATSGNISHTQVVNLTLQ